MRFGLDLNDDGKLGNLEERWEKEFYRFVPVDLGLPPQQATASWSERWPRVRCGPQDLALESFGSVSACFTARSILLLRREGHWLKTTEITSGGEESTRLFHESFLMDALFSCRNCIHDCGQSINIGRGPGFCLQHDSVIWEPGKTTCKYLHRKDLPRFVVEEGVQEHAAEFAHCSGMALLESAQPVKRVPYSEKFVWERRQFDPLTHAMAQYWKSDRRWVLIQAFSGGLDGRRSLVHAAFVRRYMNRCGSWRSSYRLVLALLQEIDIRPHFTPETDLVEHDVQSDEVVREALFDVVFARIAAIQEYGFHSGIRDLRWATDALNGGLSELDWSKLQLALGGVRGSWTEEIISHAKSEDVFFPEATDGPAHERPEWVEEH